MYKILGREGCVFCNNIKVLIETKEFKKNFKNIQVNYYDINQTEGAKLLKKYDKLIPDYYKGYVPIVIKNNKEFIEGYNGLLTEVELVKKQQKKSKKVQNGKNGKNSKNGKNGKIKRKPSNSNFNKKQKKSKKSNGLIEYITKSFIKLVE
jgi:hypothetical protein